MSVNHHSLYGPGPAPSTNLFSVYSHAVCRSDEFLSCAKTILKLAKRNHQSQPSQSLEQQWWSVSLDELRLHDLQDETHAHSSIYNSLEDAVDLLRGMSNELEILEGLVRRRGHTNDPTDDIKRSTQRLERDTQELHATLQRMIPISAHGQHQRHWHVLTQWFQGAAQEQAKRLQQVLKTRGTVLAEQAQRRKLFSSSSSSSTTNPLSPSANLSSSNVESYANNPLFRMKAPPKAVASQSQPYALPSTNALHVGGKGTSASPHSYPNYDAHHILLSTVPPPTTTSGTTVPKTAQRALSSVSSIHGANQGAGYGGRPPTSFPSNPVTASSYYYGSSSYSSATTGMRQRRAQAGAAASQDAPTSAEAQAQLLQLRQQERQTQQRLQDARQAEQSLAELGTLFGKMTHLLSVQSEIIDKVEDDVEAAHLDVAAGHGEIQTLYSIKKGNRALILKVFGLLIFFIVFMRFYKSK